MFGAVIRLPLDTSGFAPMQTNRSVRSMSGTGSSAWWPSIRYAASICGSWSSDVAANTLRVPSERNNGMPNSISPRLCAAGLP